MPQDLEEIVSEASEVYSYQNLSLSQYDQRELFAIEWNGISLEFKLCDLIAFKKKLFAIDLSMMFDTAQPDIEVIYLPGLDMHLILGLEDILNFRELLSGGFTLLTLNSMVHRALYNPFAGQLS